MREPRGGPFNVADPGRPGGGSGVSARTRFASLPWWFPRVVALNKESDRTGGTGCLQNQKTMNRSSNGSLRWTWAVSGDVRTLEVFLRRGAGEERVIQETVAEGPR